MSDAMLAAAPACMLQCMHTTASTSTTLLVPSAWCVVTSILLWYEVSDIVGSANVQVLLA